MKIGVISDIHSNSVALGAVLQHSEIQSADAVYCAGDLVGYYSRPNEVVNKIRRENIFSVKGNHDKAVAEATPSSFSVYAKRAADWTRRKLTSDNLAFLDSLPVRIRKFVGSRDLLVVHGSPKNPFTEYIYQEDVDELFLDFYFDVPPEVVVLGHTHQPFVKKVNDTLVVNPGSVGQPRDRDPRASFGIIDLDSLSSEIFRVEYDIDEIAKDTAKELPKALGDRLYEGR